MSYSVVSVVASLKTSVEVVDVVDVVDVVLATCVVHLCSTCVVWTVVESFALLVTIVVVATSLLRQVKLPIVFSHSLSSSHLLS